MKWWKSLVAGVPFRLESGIAGSLQQTNGHPRPLFPLDTTVILGDSGKSNPSNPDAKTVVHWTIPTRDFPWPLYTRGYLLIGCLRRFGGLHSPTLKDWVEIRLNDLVLDGFELQYIPRGHTDYFHETPYPDAPKVPPFSNCENVYIWSVPRSHLQDKAEQRLTITLDRDTKWDIDYLGFLFEFPEQRPQVFISYNSMDRRLAHRIAGDLKKRGIGVWIDSEGIKLGQSLLKAIEEGINLVDYVLVLISRNSIQSSWVNKELEIAMNQEIAGKRVKVFVVLVDDTALPSFLIDKKYSDPRNRRRYQFVLEEIQKRLAE